jgi:germination protein YpeB
MTEDNKRLLDVFVVRVRDLMNLCDKQKQKINELENLSVEYPELIYDGPFSDGQNQRELKGLKGEEIDDNKALERFNAIFGGYGVTNAENNGVTTGDMECYNIQGEIDGEVLFAQFSKKGGELVMFSFAGSCKDVKLEQPQALTAAEEFLATLGLSNMKAVWVNLANNLYTINFAFEVEDIIAYPDLVKVRVCAETGMVIGMEAKSYYTNHFERSVDNPKLTEMQALEKVSTNIEVESSRLAIVPVGQKSEKLCYEFSGTFDGATYYIYIDAESGRQVEMFKVIESTEGTLLM